MATATQVSEKAPKIMSRREGVITSWGDARGFGFIASGYEKFFLYYDATVFSRNEIREGLAVTFEPDYKVAKGKTPLATKVDFKY